MRMPQGEFAQVILSRFLRGPSAREIDPASDVEKTDDPLVIDIIKQ
jgi:hypothetical protein